MALAGTTSPARSSSTWWQRNERRVVPYLFIAPFYVVFVLIFLAPILAGFYFSLSEWNGIGRLDFVGLANYIALLQNAQARMAIGNTIWYVGAAILVLCPTALMVASILNHPVVRYRALFRLIYFLPILTSIIVVALMFMLLYDREVGLVNWALSLVGIPPVYWLGRSWGKVAIIALVVWRWSGYLSLFFLAGLQGIQKDLYESAEVDGANSWQKFRNVTIPGLRPIIVFVVVIVFIGSSQIFEEPYILTDGGPDDTTLSYALALYREGFVYLRIGYACAMGFALCVVTFCVSWAQIRLLGMFRED